jgi:hypothetical protein
VRATRPVDRRKKAQHDIDQQMLANAFLQKHGQRREHDRENHENDLVVHDDIPFVWVIA